MDEERIGVLSSATTTVALFEEEVVEECGERRMVAVVVNGEDGERGVAAEAGLGTRGGGGCLCMQGGGAEGSIMRGIKGSGMRGAECFDARLDGSLSIHFGVGRRQDSEDAG